MRAATDHIGIMNNSTSSFMIQKGTDRDRFKEQKITPRLDSPIAAVSSECENDTDEQMAVMERLKLKELRNSQSSAEN